MMNDQTPKSEGTATPPPLRQQAAPTEPPRDSDIKTLEKTNRDKSRLKNAVKSFLVPVGISWLVLVSLFGFMIPALIGLMMVVYNIIIGITAMTGEFGDPAFEGPYAEEIFEKEGCWPTAIGLPVFLVSLPLAFCFPSFYGLFGIIFLVP